MQSLARNVLFVLTALLVGNSCRSQDTLFAVDRANNLLRAIDPLTASTLWSVPMTLAGSTITGSNGLARDPMSGDLWVLLKISGQTGRTVGRVDPCTGTVQAAGNTGLDFASIAVGADGTLYGDTGDGAVPSETLFAINKTNGVPTLLTALGNGSDGEAIAFNPWDNQLYHASGLATQVFERIDPTTLVVTNIPQSGVLHGEFLALAPWIGGSLLMSDLSQNLFVLSTAGVCSAVGNMGFYCKGMAFAPSTWALLTVDPGSNLLRTVSAVDLTTLEAIGITSTLGTVQGCNGMARNPITGEVWVIFKLSSVRRLGRLNLDTGVVYQTATLGDDFSGITFSTTGTLYGVTGDGATVPETLYTINPTTGVATLFTALGNGNFGESICFNPNDGLIYHASGDGVPNVNEIFETVNPSGGAITNIPLSGNDGSEVRSMVPFIGNSFLCTSFLNEVYLISTTGVVQTLGTLNHNAKGIAFTSSTPFCLRTVSPFDTNLETVNRLTLATVLTTPLVDSAAGTLTGVNCMDRSQATGVPWLMAKVTGSSGRHLATVDYHTGTVTRVGNSGDNFAGMAFSRTGTLFGVTGDGATTPETLYTVNTGTAAPTLLTALGNGSDGESIAWGYGTGLIYHCSGLGTPNVAEIFESVDPSTGLVTPITYTGYDHSEMLSMTGTLQNGFLCSDLNSNVVFMNTNGVSSLLGTLSRDVRGITYDPMPRSGFSKSIGVGCAAVGASGLTPIVSSTGNPDAGGAFQVHSSNGPAGGLMLMLIGDIDVFVPLGPPLTYSGCVLQMATIAVVDAALLDGAGQFALTINVPTTVTPGSLLFQSAILEGSQFTLSNAARVHFE